VTYINPYDRKDSGTLSRGGQLGAEACGEVYVADDLNLNRKVALKFLPTRSLAIPKGWPASEREAKLLASLNHPNIAAIYGLEQAEGKRFIVMELVEGKRWRKESPKDRCRSTKLWEYASRSRRLEAAHEKGSDSPGSEASQRDDHRRRQVKILDFGLAKALSEETQSIDSSQSPTLTEAMTQPGVILGTAAYMSPEQAKGKAVDKRAISGPSDASFTNA